MRLMCSITAPIITDRRKFCYVDSLDLLGDSEIPHGHVALTVGCNLVFRELKDRVIETEVLRVEVVIDCRDIVLPSWMDVQRRSHNAV